MKSMTLNNAKRDYSEYAGFVLGLQTRKLTEADLARVGEVVLAGKWAKAAPFESIILEDSRGKVALFLFDRAADFWQSEFVRYAKTMQTQLVLGSAGLQVAGWPEDITIK